MQDLIQLFGIYFHQRFFLRNQPFVYHFHRNPQRCVCSSFPISGLQEIQFPFFYSKFHILYIFVMIFQFIGNFHKLCINLRHILCQLCDRFGCANTGYDVFALRIYQVFSQHCFLTGCRISGKGYPSTGSITHIPEYHHLHIDCCAPAVGNVVHSSVYKRTGIIPTAEYCLSRFKQLFLRILREFLPLVLKINLFEHIYYFFQVFRRQICIIFRADLFFVFIQFPFKFGFWHANYHVCKHHDKSSVGVICKSRISGFSCQPFYRNIIQTQIQNSIHHPGHRRSCARTNGYQQRIFRISQFLASNFFQFSQCCFNLCNHFICQLFPAFVILGTGFRRNREPLGNGQTQNCHFRQIRTFSAQQVPHGSVAFAEHVHILFAHTFYLL